MNTETAPTGDECKAREAELKACVRKELRPFQILFCAAILAQAAVLFCGLRVERGAAEVISCSARSGTISYVKGPDGTEKPFLSEERVSKDFYLDYKFDGAKQSTVFIHDDIETARQLSAGAKVRLFVVRFFGSQIHASAEIIKGA